MGNAVGQEWVRVDSAVKAAGQAVFIDDTSLSGMLYGKFLGSPYAHARIKSIYVEKAEALPGVRAVATGKDFPFYHGETIINIPFLAVDKVRYIGEPVVAVAADDLDTAERALELIEVEYEELPAVFDAEESLKPDAVIIHEKLSDYKTIPMIKVVPDTNICHNFITAMGDVEEGFRQSDYIFEDRFSSPQMSHAAIETHACIAQVDISGRITVWGQNDAPHRARKEIAHALGIPQAKIRIVTGYVGGNYGGKGGLKSEAIAIPLAYKLKGRPVKVVFSRDEVFKTLTRLGCVIYLKTGVRRDGTLLARQVRLIWDVGAYAEKGPTVMQSGSKNAAGPYFIPNVHIESSAVFTNKPVAGAMRGYGIPQIAFAHESQMDMIAEKLGISPFALRMKNVVVEGSKVPTGQRLYSVGLKECLQKVDEELSRDAEVAFDPTGGGVFPAGRWARGKGMACTYKPTKTPTVSSAFVKIDEDGSVGIITSTVEVGQGSHTVLTQIVAEVLTVEQNIIKISFADTDFTPYDASTTASRSTFHMGNAVLFAAEDAKEQLLALAAPLLKVKQEELKLSDGKVLANDGRALPIAKVLSGTFGAGAGAAVLGKGVYTPRQILGLEDMGDGPLEAFSTISVFHSYAAQGAEVLVDLDTGAVRVLRVVAADDVGRAINPKNCVQQLDGAISMGLGFCLSEEYIWDRGKILNANLRDYTLATAPDSPKVDVFLIETAHPQGPFGAKGVGEIANSPTAPAIANAIYNACGVRIRDLPMRPAKVLKELKTAKCSGLQYG